MRHISRNTNLSPSMMGDSELHSRLKDIESQIGIGGQVRGALYEIRDRIVSESRHAAQVQFLNKCAYCESKLDTEMGEVDWLRPVFGAERENGEIDQYHYAWLLLEWGNIYLSCSQCSHIKRNKFPVTFRCKYGMSLAELRNLKEAKIIDPCWNKPEHHFRISGNGDLIAKDSRAKITIETLELNREKLRMARGSAIQRFIMLWNHAVRNLDAHAIGPKIELGRLLARETEFVGTFYICLWQISRPADKKIVRKLIDNSIGNNGLEALLRSIGVISSEALFDSDDLNITQASNSYIDNNSFRPITEVSIRNFKGISDLKIEFPVEMSSNLAIVGENSTGKTSILQAIALGVAGPAQANKLMLDARDFVAADASSGEVVVRFGDTGEFNHLFFEKNSAKFKGKTSLNIRVFGYGPYRLLAKRELGKNKRSTKLRLSSLFDDSAKLNGYNGWLATLTDAQKVDLSEVLQLLLASRETKVTVDSDSLQISTNGKRHPLRSLSSGMQSVVAMCTDLMEALYGAGSSVLKGGYIIIVDELDAHLHPTWRLGIVKRLTRAFPNAQIIFSTHDPLTLRGLNGEQVYVLSRRSDGELEHKPTKYSDSLSIDQILTSSMFGLFTTHSSEWESDFDEYIRLLLIQDEGNLGSRQKDRLIFLTSQLQDRNLLGQTRRERIMYAVIDKFLAKNPLGVKDWDPEVINAISLKVQESVDQAMDFE